jgi:pterin-4a-carbinolamine dehydratase
MLHKLKRALIDAEQKAIGGITEEDIKIATEIEFEMASSYVFM